MAKTSTPTTDIGDLKVRRVSARNFFNTSFKGFSIADNIRSIPLLTDGLKPSQRKAIYGTLKRGENAGLLSVERLAAHVASVSDYHHGTGSMESTIVGLANNKSPGSNNANLFVPEGQFGSRLTKDPSGPRYIETKISHHFRALFPKSDDGILVHNETDGEKIEPKTYLPILPMALVNGAQGTGTGHACVILAYHPEQVRDAVLKVLSGKKLKDRTLTPWYNGFHGTIERVQETGQVVITGKLEVVNSVTIRITELPNDIFLDDYKTLLNRLEDEGFIKDYEDRSNEQAFDFTITVPRSTTALSEEALYKKFKLVSRTTENFTLWDVDGIIKRFESAEQIIATFVPWRLARYEDRRQMLIAQSEEIIRWMSEKLRFILFYLDNVSEFKNKKKDDLIALLIRNKFESYDRLLQMPMWNLTKDKIDELKKEIGNEKINLSTLQGDTAAEMYARELKEYKYDPTLS